MKNTFLNKGEDHQHFGLRKLSIGVASVLLGTTFLAYNAETIHADTTNANGTSQQVSSDVGTVENKDDVTASDNINSHLKENASLGTSVLNNELSASKEKQDNSIGNINNTKNNQVKNSPKTYSNQKFQSSDSFNEECLRASGLPEIELSDAQLAKLGLDKDTYLRNGVKYKAVGSLILDIHNKGSIPVKNVRPPHTETGDLMSDDEVYNKVLQYMEDNYNPDVDAENVSYTARLAPYIQGGTIYINKGHALDNSDAQRGLPDEYADGYQNVNWDNEVGDQVDINNAGNYNAIVDVTYKSGLGVSTSAKVDVVDLKGKTIYGSISDNGEDIDTDPQSVVTGYPEGSNHFTWVTKPDLTTVGNNEGTVEVTYPDGTKGQATVHYIISNPQWKTPTPTTPEGTVPDPHDVITFNPGLPDLPDDPHTTVTWTNGDPDVSKPGKVDTSVTVTYPDGHTTVIPGQIVVVETKTTQETKEVTRTIIDYVPGQDPIKVTQTVTFTREVTKDDKGQVIKATDWKADGPAAWDAYQAHGAAGYTANPGSIPAMAVNAGTQSTTVEIHYTKNEDTTPSTPDPTPTPQPTDPTQPTTPSNPQPSAPTDDNNKPAPAPHASAKPSKPAKKSGHKKANHKKTITTPLNGGEKGNGNHGSGDVRPLATYASKGNKQALAAANKIAGRKSALPQTGEKQNGVVAAVGAAIATVGGLFGLASRKKRY